MSITTAAEEKQGNRKSLMLEKPEYDRLSALAKKAGVPRPLVVIALLDVADETKVIAKLTELRANERASAAEERKKRQALSALAGQLDMKQIEQLLAKLSA